MSKPPSPTSRWKVALIPALLAVLGYVLWPAGSSAPDSSTGTTTPAESAAASAATKAVFMPPLPHFDVRAAIEFNPLRTPNPIRDLVLGIPDPEPQPEDTAKLLEQETLSRREQILAQVKRLKVSTILSGKEGMAAIVGSKVVRVGDQIEPGVSVIRIDAGGVLVRVEVDAQSELEQEATLPRIVH